MKLRVETREVLADAYPGRDPQARPERRMLTHAAVVNADGLALEVFCRRVDVNSLAGVASGVDRHSVPTCRVCAAALRKLRKKNAAASPAAGLES
jgi:hypothetical protein